MSDKAKFTCEPSVDDHEWDRIVNASPQGTLFSESLFLNACGRENCRFIIRQGNQIRAGLSVIHTKDGSGCELDDLVIHNGLMFVPDDTKKPVRARFQRFDITSYIIDFLDQRYNQIEMALAPGFEDMRPFLWHNYHDSDQAKKFILDLRYTSYLAIDSLKRDDENYEESEFFRAMDTLRQRHVRQSYRKGASVKRAERALRLIEYYRALMERQGDPVPESKLANLENLIDTLIVNKKAEIYEVQNQRSQVIYTVVYGWDHKRAYYLFGAGHPEYRESFQGTYAHWSAFLDLANRMGLRQVDMEGVNSPQRGNFKLSFGGKLKSYYQIYKRT